MMKTQYTIGAGEAACEYIVPVILPELVKRLKDIDLKVEIRDALKIYEKVLRGSLELGIIGMKTDSDYIDFRTIVKDDNLCVIAPADHPLTKRDYIMLNEIRGQDFVGFTLGTGTRAAYRTVFADANISLEKDLNVVVEIGDTRGVIKAVELGMGIAVVSELAAQNSIKLGKVKCLNIPMLKIQRDFYLINVKNKQLSEPAKAIIANIDDIVKTYFKNS